MLHRHLVIAIKMKLTIDQPVVGRQEGTARRTATPRQVERTVAVDAALERRRRLLFDSQSGERVTKLGTGCVRADRKTVLKMKNKFLMI